VNRLFEQHIDERLDSLVEGVFGIAMQAEQTPESLALADKILDHISERLDLLSEVTFDQKVDIMWASCALGFEKQSLLIREFWQEIQEMAFQRTDNDLTYSQFQKLRDILTYITKVSPIKDEKWVKEGRNEALDLLIENQEIARLRYKESMCNYDPFKNKVVEGITRGLTMASIEHQTTMENNLYHQNQAELSFNEDKYPLKPDVIMGYKGNKVLLNVITSLQTMSDVQKADGGVLFRQKIVRGLNSEDNVQTVSVPITAVINYDI